MYVALNLLRITMWQRNDVICQFQASSSSAATGSPEDEVIINKLDDKGVFTMNRPKVLNALSISMIRKMTASLKVSSTLPVRSD